MAEMKNLCQDNSRLPLLRWPFLVSIIVSFFFFLLFSIPIQKIFTKTYFVRSSMPKQRNSVALSSRFKNMFPAVLLS